MKMQSSIFMQQIVENLGKLGTHESHASDEFFAKMFSHCRTTYPEASFVINTGPDCNRQIIYLPQAKLLLQIRLEQELREYKQAVIETEIALDSLK